MSLFVDIKKQLPGFSLEVSFSVDHGPLGILGGSGAGKSMTLRCIAGLETPDQGRIVLNGQVLFDSAAGINLSAKARRIGLLFQNYALFPHMTVLQNICFGLQDLPKTQQLKKAAAEIAMTRLEGLEARYPHQLSGGQQQRAALARALVIKPSALLLDEPFSALDNFLRDQMVRELLDVLSAYPGPALFVTHDLGESYRICRDLMILENGRKTAHGPKEEIFRNPPTFSAAQITGCRNISAARAVTADSIEALDWGCTLKVRPPVPDGLTHVGIRGRRLVLTPDNPGPNAFPCWVVAADESPDHILLYLHLNTPPGPHKDYHLQAELTWGQWAGIKTAPEPRRVFLDPDALFLTRC